MNEYEIEAATRQVAGKPVLTAAVGTLQGLVRWANRNSDTTGTARPLRIICGWCATTSTGQTAHNQHPCRATTPA